MVCSCWFGQDAFFADRDKWAAIFFLIERRHFVALLNVCSIQAQISEAICGAAETCNSYLTEGRYPGEVMAAL